MQARSFLLCLGFALCAARAGLARPAQVEGPLDNDAYLPVDLAAEAELARGDQAYAAAVREAGGAGGPASPWEAGAARWTAACEGWRNALVRSAPRASASPRPVPTPADVSPWPALDGARERYTEGVEAAVFRRLAALPEAGLAVWRERFAPLALQEFLRANREPAELARIERELPATRGAVLAALGLAELAYERGESEAARGWLARARRHAALLGAEGAALEPALARRAEALPAPATPAPEAWASARELVPLVRRELEPARGSAPRPRPLGAGPQAGLGFLADARVLVQTPGALWIVSGPEARLAGPFENRAWLAPAELSVSATAAPGNGPGWRLDPATLGSSAVVVAGRSLAGRANVLALVDCDAEDALPRLRWVREAGPADGSAAESPDEYEFQPGPLWLEGGVLVLVRRAGTSSGERELELRALDPASGAVRWSQFLGKGGERVRDAGRFVPRGAPSLPAEPLARAAGGVLASAQLGFAALVDPLDGRPLFAVKNHRRDPARGGWTGWGASLAADGSRAGWAPADSDHLYVLDTAADAPLRGPLAAVPAPQGEAEALVVADDREALVLARSGARWALARLDLATGARSDALRLGPEERFTGRAQASPERVLAASDRALYLFDRSRDLALLAAVTLTGPTPRGGNVWARGDRVFVLSNRELEVFEAR